MLLHRRMTRTAALAVLALACGDGSTSPGTYDPDIPTEWAAAVTNPLFPLAPGTVWQYRAETGEGVETTRTVVHDQVSLDGVLAEDTFDWYAEDGDGKRDELQGVTGP